MTEPIENLYFNWLYAKVCDVRANSPSLTFYRLLSELHRTEFVWLLMGDDNRAEDGIDLRREFVKAHGEAEELMVAGCSFLEMLIALSRRAAFESDPSERKWFWMMLDNLYLGEMNDGSAITPSVIRDTLTKCIFRTYKYDGAGGLFPLLHATKDQREVELWYQLSEYIYQHDLM